MPAKRIKSAQVRDHLGQIMDEVYYRGNDYIVEKGNKPMAAIISIDEYRRLQREREEGFKVIEELWERNRDVQPGQAAAVAEEAVREVRDRALESHAESCFRCQ